MLLSECTYLSFRCSLEVSVCVGVAVSVGVLCQFKGTVSVSERYCSSQFRGNSLEVVVSVEVALS